MAGQVFIAPDKKVKLEAFTRVQAIPRSQTEQNFPVMVRVSAPESAKDSRVPVDIVAVLDISGSMSWERRLESMKAAMVYAISCLGEEDRLSVVSFETTPHLLTGLSAMDAAGRKVATDEVGKLVAGGENDMGAALGMAAQILRGRRAEQSKNRPGCIIFLSDGEDEMIFRQHISNEFPVHTFGLSNGHDPNVMRYIADKTSGVYSFINDDVTKIKEAFAMFISGLMTVTAMSININLQANEGISIMSIESGGYESTVNPDNQSGMIKINDLYAGETKHFVVYLRVLEGKEPSFLHFLPWFGNNMKLLTISGRYKNPNIVKGENIELDGIEVSVTRPGELRDEDTKISSETAAELVRLRLVKDIAEMLCNGIPHPYGGQLQDLWKSIKDSDDGKAVVLEPCLSSLTNDIKEMESGIDEVKTHKNSGLPYMLSWLTSHKWQRATMKGSPSKAATFQTIGMKKITDPTHSTDVINTQPADVSPWKKVMAWVKGIPFSHVVSFSLILVVLLLMVYFAIQWSSSGSAQDTITSHTNDATQLYDISRLSGWYKLEKDLHLVLQKVHDPELASFVQGAPVEVLNHALNQYLYLAIVHANAIEKHYASTPKDVGSKIMMLEQEVARLEGEKVELAARIEALVDEQGKVLENEKRKCAPEHNEEALQRATTRIAELERQLQDKKAFVESLLSEMANNDEHLKTCGERVDQLEAKVTELEGSVDANE